MVHLQSNVFNFIGVACYYADEYLTQNMPRRLSVSLPRVKAIIASNETEIYDVSKKKFVGPSNRIWQQLAAKLDHTISAKHLYTMIIENRHNVLENTKLISSSSDGGALEKSSTSDTEESDEIEGKKEKKITFNIVLSASEWTNLKCTMYYNRSDRPGCKRSYETLKPHEWTSLIHSKFYDVTRLPCKLRYHQSNIHDDGKVYLRLTGDCFSCKSVSIGDMFAMPKIDADVIINCSYEGEFHSCSTIQKRNVIGTCKDDYLYPKVSK